MKIFVLILCFSYFVEAEESVDTPVCKDTPLHHVKDVETARIFIQDGYDVHTKNCDGRNPLEAILVSTIIETTEIHITEQTVELMDFFIEQGATIDEEIVHITQYSLRQNKLLRQQQAKNMH